MEMTKRELLQLLVRNAKEYCPKAKKILDERRSEHGIKGRLPTQKAVEAIVVDFINFVSVFQGIDLGLHIEQLHEDTEHPITKQASKSKSNYGYTDNGVKIIPPIGWKILPENVEIPSYFRAYLQSSSGDRIWYDWFDFSTTSDKALGIKYAMSFGVIKAIAVPEETNISKLKRY